MADVPLDALVFLDAASTAVTLLLAGFFFLVGHRTGDRLHTLFGVGFALIGASFLTVSGSEFNLGGDVEWLDAARIAGQLGGAVVLFFAYVSRRMHGEPRIWAAVAWGVAVLSVAAGFAYFVVPPFQTLPPVETTSGIAHALMIVAYGGCAAFSFQGFVAQPTRDRLLVPLAFVAWGLAKYTWLLIDISRVDVLVYFVYAWRFSALGLLLAALLLPRRAPGGAHAPP